MSHQRIKAVVRGAVQGVGFRPFICRLAANMGLNGWVSHTDSGVFIEAEGPGPHLDLFLRRLENEKPRRALVHSVESSLLAPAGYTTFEIRHSDENGADGAVITPDLAVCAECLGEMFDPGNRRHLYPFINCAHCGPRFSIIESLPYHRPNTAMKQFVMCPGCEDESLDPGSRRFHSPINACPNCGPHLDLWNTRGKIHAERHEALLQAAQAVRLGKILALKGVGGFQLITDARNTAAVRRLRERLGRAEKPLTVLYPSMAAVREDCWVDDLETQLLTSQRAPIVLLHHKQDFCIADNVAPANPNLGAMLPSSPLHHLLMRELNFPVVATGGHRNNAPPCIHDLEALERLDGIADVLLVHNQPIVRPVDDSITRVILHREMILRRGRGYAPQAIHLEHKVPAILAVGSHLNNALAIGIGREIFLSQHIGDLEPGHASELFDRTGELQQLYEFQPAIVARDLNADFLSSRYASEIPAEIARVQHHYAHVLACLADNELDGPVLGVSWDGGGTGTDGTIWGGEFLLVDGREAESPVQRVAHLRTFCLPGGQDAIFQPRFAGVGLLWEIFGDSLFSDECCRPVRQQFTIQEWGVIRQMLVSHIHSPVTSSVGRLFDAVASILGLCRQTTFDGQAAMMVEHSAVPGVDSSYSFILSGEHGEVLDWEPALRELLEDLRSQVPVSRIAATFHNTLVEIVVQVARRIGVSRVALTGGCFQNKYLLERVILRLRQESFEPFWHQRIPPNDGGIAVGQILAAAHAVNPGRLN